MPVPTVHGFCAGVPTLGTQGPNSQAKSRSGGAPPRARPGSSLEARGRVQGEGWGPQEGSVHTVTLDKSQERPCLKITIVPKLSREVMESTGPPAGGLSLLRAQLHVTRDVLVTPREAT